MPHGKLLVRFVDATFGSADELADVRDELAETLGMDTLIDIAAVISNFHMMTRIADATGTPLDKGTEDISEELRTAIGVDDFATKRFSPPAST